MNASPIEKIWGLTTPLVQTPLFEMHRLNIKPMHRCSFHTHQSKSNTFYVIWGSLWIDSEVSDRFERHMMRGGDVYTVSPGVAHQFRTAEAPCCALEMYFTEPLSEDIIRRNVGGALW